MRRLMLSGKKMEEKAIQLIGRIDVTEDTASDLSFVFDAEEYPKIKDCYYLWFRIVAAGNTSRPYVHVSINDVKCNPRINGGSGGCSFVEIQNYRGNAIVTVNDWVNVSYALLRDTEGCRSTGMASFVGSEIKKVSLLSYTKFMDAGGYIELYGF